MALLVSPFEHCHTLWVSLSTLLTETWFSFQSCNTRGTERAPSFTISPVGMLATAMDSWTRLRIIATLCICRAADWSAIACEAIACEELGARGREPHALRRRRSLPLRIATVHHRTGGGLT